MLHCSGYGEVAALTALVRCVLEESGQNVTASEVTSFPVEFLTVKRRKSFRPFQPSRTVLGRGRRFVVPRGAVMSCVIVTGLVSLARSTSSRRADPRDSSQIPGSRNTA